MFYLFKGSPKKHGLSTNNCRIEGISEKKLYHTPLTKGNRCVVLCDGFYEWKTNGKNKQPYFIHSPQPDGVCIIWHSLHGTIFQFAMYVLGNHQPTGNLASWK